MATGVPADRMRRLSGGDLWEVLLVPRAEGAAVAKGGPHVAVEAQMLHAITAAGVPAPLVEAEYGDVLLIQYLAEDGAFSPRAWASVGEAVRRLHDHRGGVYGWPVDYALGSVSMDNREGHDWPAFWGRQRLALAAALLDRPWRERVEGLSRRLGDLLPARPPASLLHGDLWAGNILVHQGHLAGLIDPACYHGDAEVDLAMLCLFGAPDEAFWEAYGPLEPGWEARRPLYQLFPAIVHLRLFGASYASLVDRLLIEVGA